MTQAIEAETVELAIVSCETCDQLFLCSARRDSCPTCGGPAGLRFFEFLGDASGLHLKDGTLAALDAAPVAAPEEGPVVALAAPAEGEAAGEGDEGDQDEHTSFRVALWAFIDRSPGVSEDYLRRALADMGAEPEDATTAVGRLAAVRDLLQDLEAAGLESEVSVGVLGAPVEGAELVPEPAVGEPPAAPQPAQAEEEQESEPSRGV